MDHSDKEDILIRALEHEKRILESVAEYNSYLLGVLSEDDLSYFVDEDEFRSEHYDEEDLREKVLYLLKKSKLNFNIEELSGIFQIDEKVMYKFMRKLIDSGDVNSLD